MTPYPSQNEEVTGFYVRFGTLHAEVSTVMQSLVGSSGNSSEQLRDFEELIHLLDECGEEDSCVTVSLVEWAAKGRPVFDRQYGTAIASAYTA